MRSLIYILILFPSLIFSQTVGFKYQAVVRNANGDLLVNQQVSFKTTILSGSAIGTEIYSETHTVGTNGYGVVNLNIGNGTAVSGSYSNIDWSSATHFLKTELDITGGSSYQFMGTSQILSVPYSEYAEMSGSSMVDNDTSATNEIQQLSLVGNQLVLSNGGSVTLTGTVDLDADPSNELQSLSLSNDTLYLSQGNNVVLPPDSDGDATNELQALSLSNDTLYLTSGGYVVLPTDSDGDATNEIQVLSLSNDTLYLTSGGYAVLPPDSDGDATNEIQVLSLSNDTLYLTSGGYAVLPQENDADTTNEIQALSLSNDTLYLTNGGFAVLPQEIDADTTNEIQALSLSNDTLYLTEGGFAVLPQELDSDTTNEIQTLSYTNDTLSISGGNNVTISSSNFDFIYPDGKSGITPLVINSGDTVGNLYFPNSAWPFIESSFDRSYTVPSGKHLIIHHVFNSDQNYYSNSSEIKINNNTIFKGKSNWTDAYNDGYHPYDNYASFAKPLSQPIYLSEGDILELNPGYKDNTTIYPYFMCVSGFLIDKKNTLIITEDLNASSYVVPPNKVLVILNLYSDNGYLYLDGQSQGRPLIGGQYNVNISNSSVVQRGHTLEYPILVDENKTVSGTMIFNGYLMNK